MAFRRGSHLPQPQEPGASHSLLNRSGSNPFASGPENKSATSGAVTCERAANHTLHNPSPIWFPIRLCRSAWEGPRQKQNVADPMGTSHGNSPVFPFGLAQNGPKRARNNRTPHPTRSCEVRRSWYQLVCCRFWGKPPTQRCPFDVFWASNSQPGLENPHLDPCSGSMPKFPTWNPAGRSISGQQPGSSVSTSKPNEKSSWV